MTWASGVEAGWSVIRWNWKENALATERRFPVWGDLAPIRTLRIVAGKPTLEATLDVWKSDQSRVTTSREEPVAICVPERSKP